MEIEGVRRSDRIAESKVFFNIYGDKNDGPAENTPPVVYRFHRQFAKSINFNHEMERGDLTYAPSVRNPYYMSVPASMLPLLAGDSLGMPQWATKAEHVNGLQTETVTRAVPSVEITSSFYVSLKLFHDMANDEVNWESLRRLEDPQVVPTSDLKTRQEAETVKKIAFAELGDPPKKDPIDKQPYNPPMIKPELEEEMVIEEEYTDKGLAPHLANQTHDSSSVIDWQSTRRDIRAQTGPKKPWRLYIPIRHQRGWLIWIRKPNWKLNRKERRGQLIKLKKAFNELWIINTATDPESAAGYRPRYSSADLGFPLYVVPQLNILKRRLGWEANQINTQFAGLIGQINNGMTQPNMGLIVATDEQVNREGLIKMGENPFRLFTTYVSVGAFDTYMKGLEVVTDTDPSITRQNAHRFRETSDTKLESWVKDNYNPKRAGYTRPQKTARAAVREWKTRADFLYSKEGKCGSTWRIGVGRDKIKDAGGKRLAKYSPKEIMGMSANEAAENAFGWKLLDQAETYLGHMHKLSNGMYMAEWLHLCAFSWGGLTTSSKKADSRYRSSDIPENLIIGTSETNSVMTRFEKAWQALVRDESCLMIRGKENSGFKANLIVTRNSSGESVIRDQKENNNYSRTSSSITTEESSVAQLYHFVAYTVSYSIEFPKGCRLLAMSANSRLETTFYPFLRPLYHRLEVQLDQMLYERIKGRYKGYPISYGMSATSTSGDVYDGTMLQSLSLVNGTGPYTVEERKGSSKKAKGDRPHNTAGEIQVGAGIHPFLGSKKDKEPKKKLKTR